MIIKDQGRKWYIISKGKAKKCSMVFDKPNFSAVRFEDSENKDCQILSRELY
jgi:hypothetical protein